jgi:hypothetical protein
MSRAAQAAFQRERRERTIGSDRRMPPGLSHRIDQSGDRRTSYRGASRLTSETEIVAEVLADLLCSHVGREL